MCSQFCSQSHTSALNARVTSLLQNQHILILYCVVQNGTDLFPGGAVLTEAALPPCGGSVWSYLSLLSFQKLQPKMTATQIITGNLSSALRRHLLEVILTCNNIVHLLQCSLQHVTGLHLHGDGRKHPISSALCRKWEIIFVGFKQIRHISLKWPPSSSSRDVWDVISNRRVSFAQKLSVGSDNIRWFNHPHTHFITTFVAAYFGVNESHECFHAVYTKIFLQCGCKHPRLAWLYPSKFSNCLEM